MIDENITEKEFINSDEVARLLCVKTGTVYSWMHYKQLPEKIYRKLGRKPIFIQQAVMEWFLSGAELKKRKCKPEP